jgi:F0F1-type ATP synthase membrane subunit b/b'
VNPAQMNLNPMTQIDPVVIVGIMLIVSVTYLLLRRVFVLPYLHVMEERERMFEAADARHDEADASVRTAKENAERLIADAAAQAEKLRTDATERADAYRTQRLGAATAGASSVLEKGRELIASDRARELEGLRTEACECVGLACQRLLGKADDTAVASAVDRALERHGG